MTRSDGDKPKKAQPLANTAPPRTAPRPAVNPALPSIGLEAQIPGAPVPQKDDAEKTSRAVSGADAAEKFRRWLSIVVVVGGFAPLGAMLVWLFKHGDTTTDIGRWIATLGAAFLASIALRVAERLTMREQLVLRIEEAKIAARREGKVAEEAGKILVKATDLLKTLKE